MNKKKKKHTEELLVFEKMMFPIMIKNHLPVTPAKKVRFENEAQASILISIIIIVEKNLNNTKKVF